MWKRLDLDLQTWLSSEFKDWFTINHELHLLSCGGVFFLGNDKQKLLENRDENYATLEEHNHLSCPITLIPFT